MQDHSLTATSLSPILLLRDESQLINELMTLDSSQIMPRLLLLSTVELISLTQSTFLQFGKQLRTNVRLPAEPEGSENSLMEPLKPFLDILDPSITILLDRLMGQTQRINHHIYKSHTFIAQSLSTLLGAIGEFRSVRFRIKGLQLLSKLSKPKGSSNSLSLFDPTIVREFFQTEFGNKHQAIGEFPHVTPQYFVNLMITLLQDTRLPYTGKYFAASGLLHLDKPCLVACLESHGGLASIIRYISQIVDDFVGELPGLDPSPPPDPTIFQRAFLRLALQNHEQQVQAPVSSEPSGPSSGHSSRSQTAATMLRLMYLVLTTLEANPCYGQTIPVQSHSLGLFSKLIRLHFQIKGPMVWSLSSPFFNGVILVLRMLAIQFKTPKVPLPLAPIINYTLFITGFIAHVDGYTWLTNSQSHPIHGGRFDFLQALAPLLQLLKYSYISTDIVPIPQSLLVLELGLIFTQFIVGYTPVLDPNIQVISSDYYSIFWDFYSKLPSLPLPPITPLDSTSSKILSFLFCVLQPILGDSRPTSLLSIRLHHFSGNMQLFLHKYHILPTLSIVLCRHGSLFEAEESNDLHFICKMFKNFSLDRPSVDDFYFQFPGLFENAARVFRDIITSFCQPQSTYSSLFRCGLDKSRAQILSYINIPMRRIAASSRLYPIILNLSLADMFKDLQLCDGMPSDNQIIGITSVFSIMDDLYKSSVIRTSQCKPETSARLIGLLGHAFLLYAGNPRALPATARGESIEATLARSEAYSDYGRHVIESILMIVKRCELDSDWLELLVGCRTQTDLSMNVPAPALVHFSKLIQIPSSHVLRTGTRSDSSALIYSIVPVLFRLLACWTHHPELGFAVGMRIHTLTKMHACARYVVSLTSYIGLLSYEITRTYFRDAKLNHIITCILGRLLTEPNNMRILLLRDRFGDWYRNILRYPDYANHSKLTEPAKLTMPIVREIFKNIDQARQLFLECGDNPNMVRLHEYSAVGLSYFSLSEHTHASFIGLNPHLLDLDSFFSSTNWLESNTPFGVLMRMLFGTLDFGENDSIDSPSVNTPLIDEHRNRAAAYALNYHAFFKTTPLRRRMKWAMKDSLTLQSSILLPIIQAYSQEVARGRGDETITFIPDDPDKASGEVNVPRSLVVAMSPVWADMLEAGGQESNDLRITLPYACYTSLAHLVLRMRTLLDRGNRRRSRLDNAVLDIARIKHPVKLRGLLDLADRYRIDFLRQYCVGGVVRLLFTASRAPRPAQALHAVYNLFAEGDSFPLFRASPELAKFTCHLIALHLPGFLCSPSNVPTIDNAGSNARPSSNLEDVSSDEDVLLDEDTNTRSDDSDDDPDNSLPEPETAAPYLHSLSPSLMARWWADLYFRPPHNN